MTILIVVIYDGINNSVFQSQVLAPLLMRKKVDPAQEIHLISFEKDAHMIVPKNDGITFHIFKQLPFVHRACLWPAIKKLQSFLKQYKTYEILARGPFAGYIAYHATHNGCSSITIQARGLVAEEYRYTLGTKKLNFFEKYRYRQFLNLEKKIYGMHKPYIHFEAVSPALKEYMITNFKTNHEDITIASNDIPTPISPEQKKAFRSVIRTKLNIKSDAKVYCYSGSYKPWQCPSETIAYFKNIHHLNSQAVLLILTLDIQAFEVALMQAALPPEAYRLKAVPQSDLLTYLTAADFGLLLREAHIINFVSRPTKALEYHAAGLTVLHNDTVAYLKNLTYDQNIHPEKPKLVFLQNRSVVSVLQEN